MIAISSFSVIARQLRYVLANNINEVSENEIYIGNPKVIKPDSGKNSLNLFFYRVEHAGFPSDADIHSPLFVRLNCLISAFGITQTIGKGSNKEIITAGENDLRLIGEVMRVMHENPVMKFMSQDYPLHLQTVQLPISLDDISHLWSPVGEEENSYRLSIAYEIALAPVPMSHRVDSDPKVGVISSGISPIIDDEQSEESSSESVSDTVEYSPAVLRTVINVKQDYWLPHIAFVINDNEMSYSLRVHEQAGVQDFEIILAGKEESEIFFEWEYWQWNYVTDVGGWNLAVADELSREVIIPEDDPDNGFYSNIVDPSNINPAQTYSVRFPDSSDPSTDISKQAVLYAYREVTRLNEKGVSQSVRIRSNPLLISMFKDD